VRLQLDPQALDITASSEGSSARQVGGLAVPYEVEARLTLGGAAKLVTFAAGSVAVEGASPLLLGHDPNRPVGVLVASEGGEAGLRATYAIDQTSDGDAALTQAQSGSRRGLSVGVDLEEFEEDPENPERIRVVAARLAETSLVAMAAFVGAGVDQIAAHRPGRETAMSETTPKPAEPEPEQPEPGEPEPEPESTQARRQPLVIAERGLPDMRLGEYVQTLVRAERGDTGARQRIEAQLTRGNITTSPGVVPITYVNQVIDSLGADRPLFAAMDHADMPGVGMTIRRPEITTRPDGAFLADDTAGAPTSAAAIVNHDVAVRQWAWGGSASVALVERSSPSYIEEIFTQAVKNYYLDVEADIASAFPTAVSTIATVGPAVAAFMAAYRTFPTLLVVGGDAYGKLLDATGIMMFASGNVDAAGNGSYAGLRVVPSADVAAADAWVTAGDFQEIRESSPIRLTVSDVTSLSLEIGVTSFYARTATRQTLGGVPGAVRIAAFAPVAAEASKSTAKGR
jgi:HK97 family phage prohead protease